MNGQNSQTLCEEDMKNLPNEVSDFGLNFNAAKLCT